jgi:RNA polymerase sigma factor (sigma-70 family)
MTAAELAEANMAVAGAVVNRLRTQIAANGIGMEDAHAVALLALVRAAHVYDPARGATFTTWAWRRCTTAVIDAMRVENRALRGQGRDYQKREADWRFVSLDETFITDDGGTVRRGDTLPDSHDVAEQARDAEVRDALRQLPARERRALVMQAMGYSHAEIGETFGVSATRACQLAGAARRRMGSGFAGAPG